MMRPPMSFEEQRRIRRRPPTPAERASIAVKFLAANLRGREDHASFCGLLTRNTAFGLVIEWRDTLCGETGHLITVPKDEQAEELIISAVARALADWKERAKESKYAERQGSVRRLDPEAHRRAVAGRTVPG